MAKRLKRRGATVTFSVSVDLETKKILKAVANRSYRGNVSELITQVARLAARQDAAAKLLESHGRSPMTDREAEAFEGQVAIELSRQHRPGKHRPKAA